MKSLVLSAVVFFQQAVMDISLHILCFAFIFLSSVHALGTYFDKSICFHPYYLL